MKTAKATVHTIEIQCPYCNEPAESPYTGSQLWPIYDVDYLITSGGQVYECDNCGEEFKIPARVPGCKIGA